MTDFNPGDRVLLHNIRFNDVWSGCKGTVLSEMSSSWDGWRKYKVKVDGPKVYTQSEPDGTNIGQIHESSMTLLEEAPKPTLDDLRRVVDSLRDQGYTVDVKVTPPSETITL